MAGQDHDRVLIVAFCVLFVLFDATLLLIFWHPWK